MTNEIQVQENNSITVRENDQFVVMKDENGKYSCKAKYQEFSTITAETREDKIWLMNLLEGSDEKSNGLKEHVGKQIAVADVITRPYDKINEDTGIQEYGVLTYLITEDKVAYVTSAKSVYFSVKQMVELFGNPTAAEPFLVKVLKEKMQNGDAIKIKMVG